MPHIVTLTLNPTIDLSCTVSRISSGRKLRCGEPHRDPGGGGLNVARAIGQLGGQATALWTAGGPMGQLLGELLDREGVPHQRMPIEGDTRENFIVFDESSEQQYRFGMPGPELSGDEVERCVQTLRGLDPPPDWLVLSGSLPPGVADSVYAQFAREVPDSCRTVVDTSGAALKRAIEAPVYLIKPNLKELGELSGREVEGDEQIVELSRRLIRNDRVEIVVTSLGSGGAVLVTGDYVEHIRSPTVRIQSRVGAGDSMVAGIVLALSQEKSLPDAVRFGVAAGAAAVMTERTDLCHRDETERLFGEMTA